MEFFGLLIPGLVDTLHGRGMSIAVRNPESVESQGLPVILTT